MSSQYGEHALIAAHFAGRDPSTLRFLDIGAFDGVTFSNTRHLADAGWSGVCVEPSPPAFCHLMRNYEGNERVDLVNAALTRTRFPKGADIQPFHCNTADALSADMMSSFDPAHVAKWKGFPFRQIWIPRIEWGDLLFQFYHDGIGPFNFVNLDIEGLNGQVLADMPIRPEMVCVEWDKEVDEDQPMRTLETFGYESIIVVGGNILAWK